MKRILVFILSIIMVLSLVTACSGSDSKETEKKEDTKEAADEQKSEKSSAAGAKETLIIGTEEDINNLNLQQQKTANNNIILKTTHQTLVFFNNDPNAETRFDPGLATEWEFIDDTHIRFKLREDVHFNDEEKTPFTAEDAKFTLDMAVSDDSMVQSILNGYVSSTVEDDYTLNIEIESYNNEFVASLSSVPISIQSKKAWESGMEEPWYIGTGPYKFEKWEEGVVCRLAKVDDYWGNDLPAEDVFSAGVAEAIEFRPYLEASSRVIALQNGEIDVCINPPMNELQYLEEDDNITVHEQQGTRLFYFGFNVQKEPWDNETLRQAVSCAINREDVLTVALDGKGTLQKTILNRGLWGFYDDMEGFTFDVERAKELMAEAGYPDGGIETSLTFPTSGAYANIATVIQSNLAEIGINVSLNPMEEATLKESCVNGEHELFLWRWNEDSKVDFVYRDLFYTGITSNYHHYADPYADELIDIVATEKDQDKRAAASTELQEYLVNASPQVPLYIANLVIAYNKNLQGQYFYGGGNHNWSRAYIAE
ncbi:MAG: ABC transporter substrate-binding protein [Saccharofermentanales bacterium]